MILKLLSNQALSTFQIHNFNYLLIVETNGIYLPHSKLALDNLISNLKSFSEINLKTMLLLLNLLTHIMLNLLVTTWTLVSNRTFKFSLILLMVPVIYWSLLVKVMLLTVKRLPICSKEWFQALATNLDLIKRTLLTLLLPQLTSH